VLLGDLNLFHLGAVQAEFSVARAPERLPQGEQYLVSETTMISRLRALPAHLPCETCLTWTPQGLIHDALAPHNEDNPACGRRVPIGLLRVYHFVDLDASGTKAEKACELVPAMGIKSTEGVAR
jgi:hypothetical protein